MSHRWYTTAVVLLLVAAPAPASGDPILTPPPLGKGVLVGDGGPGSLGLVAEVGALGILGAERLTSLPDYGLVRSNEPELGLARVGLVRVADCRGLGFSLRFDFAEVGRIDSDQVSETPFGVVDSLIDDLALFWTPRVWAGLVAGRYKVPFSRFRQLERSLLAGGAVPFLTDRIAPDRRWGLTAHGDLGAISYAGGFYSDSDELELTSAGDPSAAGRFATSLHLEWTPRAPIGEDQLATSASDPWYDTVKVSAGAGLLYRWREAVAGNRLDVSLDGQIKFRRYAAIAELILTSTSAELALSGAGEASVFLTDNSYLFVRGDYDVSVDLWSTGGGAAYFVTEDRRNKLTLMGWVRRDREGGSIRRDGLVVQLQATL